MNTFQKYQYQLLNVYFLGEKWHPLLHQITPMLLCFLLKEVDVTDLIM